MNKQTPSNRLLLITEVTVVIIGLIVFGVYFFGKRQLDTENGLKTSTESVIINGMSREIMETDGIKHTVPLDEILSGGPPKDGIPPIDDPKFVSIQEASKFIEDDEPGLIIDMDGVKRFYPFQIMVWHEIVNDVINGKRVLVTYCPLCFSGIVFDPIVKGERVEFGTSGRLWNSNLVMYDRKTETYWSQILGEGIKGELAGQVLDVLPSDVVKFGDWKSKNPEGEVLSRDTGAKRFYGSDPYGSYYTDKDILFPVSNRDDRLNSKDFVLGLVVDDKSKAYRVEDIKVAGEVKDSFASEEFALRYDKDLDTVRIYKQNKDGTEVRINPFGTYWFSWVAAHPDTDLYTK